MIHLQCNCFNHYAQIPSFKMPTIRQVWQLNQHGSYNSSIDLKDAYLHTSIIKHHCHFYILFSNIKPYQWKALPFGLARAPRVFTSFTKHITFLC